MDIELLPELAKCIKTSIQHEYFQCDFKHLNIELVNNVFEYRREQMQFYEKEGRWEAWVFSHRPDHRLYVTLKIIDKLPGERMAKLIGLLWNDPDVVLQSSDVLMFTDFCRLALSDPSFSLAAMTSSELLRFQTLPEEVRLYRAHGQHNANHISWTLSKEVALRIQKAQNYEFVTERVFRRSDCICFFDRRGEDEVIVSSLTAAPRLDIARENRVLTHGG